MPEPAPRRLGRRGRLLGEFFALSANWVPVALAAGLTTLDWASPRGKLLLYGDATAHMMIARRMVDSLTPGLSQWGSVWLPLPHLLDAALIRIPDFWRTGLAGALISLLSLVLGTWMLHRLVKREAGALAAGWAAACFCLNPGLLYLAVTPMADVVYMACFIGLVDQCSVYAHRSRRRAERRLRPPLGIAWAAGGFALAAAMTRYDGWFVLPFACLALALGAASLAEACAAGARFLLVSVAGPVFWLVYNWFYYDDALDFLRGPYSARQIYARALRQGGARYPGDHAFFTALHYYLRTAATDCSTLLLGLGLLGTITWLAAPRRRLALGLLLLPLPWYVWAMYAGNVPIFIPALWPHSYYNSRYGLELLPAAAVFSGLAVGAGWTWLHQRRPGWATAAVAAVALALAASFAVMLGGDGPLVYAEAVHNAPARLQMERQLALALEGEPGRPRRPQDRVLMYLGDYPGALADDNIPLRQVVNESNFLLFQDALAAPQKYVDWVIIERHTEIDKLINRAALARYFQPVVKISVTGQPDISVYRKQGAP